MKNKLKFHSELLDQNLLKGKVIHKQTQELLSDAMNIGKKKKVEAKKHTIVSGPPGVGKSYSTWSLCERHKLNHMVIAPGSSDINLVTRLASKVYRLKKNEELIVILDDADDLVFGNYETLNKWKIAMAKPDPDIGFMPVLNHSVSMNNTFKQLEKAGRDDLLEALASFEEKDGIGVSIPTDRCRFIVLCNQDLENPKAFRGKLASAVAAVLDRFNYDRLQLSRDDQWGWLAYVLSTSQPFPNFPLRDKDKVAILEWMDARWTQLRSTSYRNVETMAEKMINYPTSYKDKWNQQLKKINGKN